MLLCENCASYSDIMTTDTTEAYDYSDNFQVIFNHTKDDLQPQHCRETACVITVIFNVIIFLLGITGNGAVIWITGFKMKKSVNTTWYLSLALSDFIFCATLPFTIDYNVKNSWIFGLFMCKFTAFVMTLNMYSSIFILVIISVDRCITVKFPVWAQNRRTVRKASLVVVLAWFVSSLLSIPPAKFREIHNGTTVICFNNFEGHHKTVVFIRFTFGFLIPFLTIFTCYLILICKLKANQMSKFTKPFKIMTLLITAFFICWLPFQIVSVLEVDRHGKEHDPVFVTALKVSASLTCANSFLNPFLYAFMAKDSKKKCYSFLSKIESAIDEET
ncbi:hypothetical protein QQF64_026752 [Cirrhinus molitorella]|uniref:G-protein coupled receptors family 1 profile domain-containing protein n=1 Tax=Cirrhinus molitorella TaxID=172907 RepID=A0ABR3NB00_9TELE